MKTALPLCIGKSTRDKVMGEQGVTVMNKWTGFLQSNNWPAKEHITFQWAPKWEKHSEKAHDATTY